MNLLAVVYGEIDHASSRSRVFLYRPCLASRGIEMSIMVYHSRRARRFEAWLDRPGLVRRAVGWWYYRVISRLGLARLAVL